MTLVNTTPHTSPTANTFPYPSLPLETASPAVAGLLDFNINFADGSTERCIRELSITLHLEPNKEKKEGYVSSIARKIKNVDKSATFRLDLDNASAADIRKVQFNLVDQREINISLSPTRFEFSSDAPKSQRNFSVEEIALKIHGDYCTFSIRGPDKDNDQRQATFYLNSLKTEHMISATNMYWLERAAEDN